MSDLTADEKLVALGLKAPSSRENPHKDLFQQVADAVSYGTFVSDVEGLSSFDAYESYLQDTIGMDADDASRFRILCEQKYGDMATFQSALGEEDSFDGWEAEFKFGDTFGMTPSEEDPTHAGVRVHSEAGVSFEGVAVQKGTVEVFGPRIEMSQTGAFDRTAPDFSYTNLDVSDHTPYPHEEIEITATVTNNQGVEMSPLVRLFEDGRKVDSQAVTVGGNASRTVTFTRSWSDYVQVDLRIEDSNSMTVTVQPPELVQ